MIRSILLNPFLIISTSFSLSFLLYLLPFSELYRPLTIENTLPFLYFVFLNIMASFFWNKFKVDFNVTCSLRVKKKVNILGYLVLILISIELLIYGVPILGQVNYTDFGAPILHVMLVSCLLILSIFSCFTYRYNKWWIFISLIISLVILNRFLILFICISGVITYISINKISFKVYVCLFIGLILLVLFFGLLGNWRMSMIMDVPYEQAKKYILYAGNASDYFKDTDLPVSFFWFWLYITSPISNLILNVDLNTSANISNFINFISFELMPQTLSKHIGNYPFSILLISKNMNVSSAITPAYVSLGYFGVTIYFLYYSFIYFLVGFLTKGIMKCVIVVLFSTLSSFMVFYNVIVMPIFIFSISVVFILSISMKRIVS